MAVLVPDGWFYKDETRSSLGLEGFYTTKEDIDQTGRFSTGLSVFIYRNFKTSTEADNFSTDLLVKTMHFGTTTKVIGAWDSKTTLLTFHHLQIEAAFPYEIEVNSNKTIHYVTASLNNTVYLVSFESPSAIWELTFKTIGHIILDNLVLLR